MLVADLGPDDRDELDRMINEPFPQSPGSGRRRKKSSPALAAQVNAWADKWRK